MQYSLNQSICTTELSIHIVPDHENMSRLAAHVVLDALSRLLASGSPLPLRVVLSGGRTPMRTYELLATEHLGEFDWSTVHLYQMDEYVDPRRADQDFCRFLTEKVINPFGIKTASLIDRTVVPTGAGGWHKAIIRHERNLVDAGGIDLVLHGIGTNGHIGLNEPGSDRLSAGRVVSLSINTHHSVRSDPVPTRGVTLGLRALLAARETILLASGRDKACAVARMICGPIRSDCPASFLRTTQRSTVIIDEAAATGVEK